MTANKQNHLNPEKLLLSKWTAVESRDKEKHFLVTKVIDPEKPKHLIENAEYKNPPLEPEFFRTVLIWCQNARCPCLGKLGCLIRLAKKHYCREVTK